MTFGGLYFAAYVITAAVEAETPFTGGTATSQVTRAGVELQDLYRKVQAPEPWRSPGMRQEYRDGKWIIETAEAEPAVETLPPAPKPSPPAPVPTGKESLGPAPVLEEPPAVSVTPAEFDTGERAEREDEEALMALLLVIAGDEF